MGCGCFKSKTFLRILEEKNFLLKVKGDKRGFKWCGEYAVTEKFITCTIDLKEYYGLSNMGNMEGDKSKLVTV